jgi:hypothetical protein
MRVKKSLEIRSVRSESLCCTQAQAAPNFRAHLYLTTLGKKSSIRNLPKNPDSAFSSGPRISGISNDMRELEAGDTSVLVSLTAPDSVYRETWRITTLGGADV